MKHVTDDLSPPTKLALAYTPVSVRGRFELLLRFDSRFASIIGTATETMIAQIKIAWWRDAFLAAPEQRPRGEPMLAALFETDDQLLVVEVGKLADAWELLLVEERWSQNLVANFAKCRGEVIFRTYAGLAELDAMPFDVAARWALDDLRLKFGIRVPQMDLASAPLPKQRALRPLTILTLSVRDVSGPRLLFHALTGR